MHPTPPSGRWTDPNDLPAEQVGYAVRDLARLTAAAATHGDNIGIYAARLLDDPLPGPGCGRSIGCWEWSAATAPARSTPPAAPHFPWMWCRRQRSTPC